MELARRMQSGPAPAESGVTANEQLLLEKLAAEKERALVTLQSIGDAVITTDAQGYIDYLNPVAESLTGWSLDEVRGRATDEVLKLIDEVTRAPMQNPVLRVLNEGSARVQEQRLARGLQDTPVGADGVPLAPLRPGHGDAGDRAVLITRSGQEIAIQESAAPICDPQGGLTGAVVVFHDVTRERRLKRALAYQASHDALTGLINRREFDLRLQAAVMSAQRGEGEHALLYIDLDQFKVVNDTCGHPAGDRLLRDITGLLQTRVRMSDTIARLGGDEFGVLLDDCAPEQAARVADGIRQAIRDYRFEWGTSTMSVGASIGVVEIRRHTENVASVMTAADIACYTAKDGGRNRIHVYDPSGMSARHREMHWVVRVTRAAEENRFELFFQPIVALIPYRSREGGASIDESLDGGFYELTVRLRGRDSQLVQPKEFIPAAERYNVMSIIDQWVITRAVTLLRERHARGAPPLRLAVNLSGTSLNEQSFIQQVLETVSDPVIAASLCFEITETAAVTNLSDAIYFMREAKSRGCRFSLDDFGAGLSSFMYLKSLPVDYLKIDGQFVGQIASDPVDRSMVEAIAKVGKALGIATIAECVESEDVLTALKQIGVDYAQGHLLAAPLPIAALT